MKIFVIYKLIFSTCRLSIKIWDVNIDQEIISMIQIEKRLFLQWYYYIEITVNLRLPQILHFQLISSFNIITTSYEDYNIIT